MGAYGWRLPGTRKHVPESVCISAQLRCESASTGDRLPVLRGTPHRVRHCVQALTTESQRISRLHHLDHDASVNNISLPSGSQRWVTPTLRLRVTHGASRQFNKVARVTLQNKGTREYGKQMRGWFAGQAEPGGGRSGVGRQAPTTTPLFAASSSSPSPHCTVGLGLFLSFLILPPFV